MGLQLDSGNADLNRPIPPTPQHVKDAVAIRTLRVADEEGWDKQLCVCGCNEPAVPLDHVLGMLFDPIKRGQA